MTSLADRTSIRRKATGAAVMYSALSWCFGSPAASEEFSISFEWGDFPLCTSGDPNMVKSPKFAVQGLPEGTNFIEFVLVDLDVPDFDHGGGVVSVTKDGIIEPGQFEYLSPCPPDGQHTYEWAAYAIAENTEEAETLGEAFFSRPYPE